MRICCCLSRILTLLRGMGGSSRRVSINALESSAAMEGNRSDNEDGVVESLRALNGANVVEVTFVSEVPTGEGEKCRKASLRRCMGGETIASDESDEAAHLMVALSAMGLLRQNIMESLLRVR
ncbi:MAG: hypothetical protein SGARI_005188 [Bacillariaceae sp.]